MSDTGRLLAFGERALAAARARGASAAEASVTGGRGFSVSARMGETETIEHRRDEGLSVTVFFGARTGSASASGLNDRTLEDTVAAACAIARHTSEDDCAGLADADRMARELPDLAIDCAWELDIDRAVELAIECENAMRAKPHIVNSEGASVQTGRSTLAYVNTHGFAGAYTGTRHGLSAVAVAGVDDELQRDYWFTSARDPARLEPATQVGERAATRAASRLGARRLDTRKTPVLFAPETATSLLGHFASAIAGGALYRKTSFLFDQLGKQCFASRVRLEELPRLPGGISSAPFDGEGVATRDHVVVADGVLREYALDSYAARKLGMATTANADGLRNLTIQADPGAGDLLAELDSGLLVTELIGPGVNLTTGDYSRGAAGFWIENGAIVHPVEEVVIAGNLSQMFKDIEAIGDNIDERTGIRCGSLLIGQMTVAGD